MSEVQTFRAATMQEALDRVRHEMGTDAVILHTRQVARRRLLPWRKPKEEVEITAGLGVNIRPAAARPRATGGAHSEPGRRGSGPSPTSPQAKAASIAAALGLDRQLPRRPRSTDDLQTGGGDLPVEQWGRRQARPQHADRSPSCDSVAFERTTTDAEVFTSKLDSIQRMLEELGRSSRTRNAPELPGELFHLYADLIDREVEDDLARDLVFRLKEKTTPEQLADAAAARALLGEMVESEIRTSGPIVPTPGRRKVVALVGATGVGKTTTIAKLAANFRLRDGIKMGLVTVDTYRIAAVEQLRTYAEIIDLPMKVVTSPPEMRRALDELVGLDLVLIDTAGRSPRDELQIQELKSLLAEANVDEVHLVLSMTASLRTLEATAQKFAAANTSSLIVTKLDEAACMGTLLSIAQKIPLPISYLTTGQDVPDDIEAAGAARIARLVLGEETL